MSVVKNTKTGKWDAWFYVRSDDGTLKKTAKKGFALKSEAQKYEQEHKHESENKKSMTFEEVFEAMSLANRANNTTTATRRQRLSTYAKTLWNKPISKISKPDLVKWRDDLSRTDLATNTKNDIVHYVKQVFKYAYETYDVYDSAKVLKTFPLELEDMHELNIITYEQLKSILDAENDEVLKIFFQFLFMTGCRKGEARALLKTDFDGKSVLINKAMRRYESSIRTTKTRTQRRVYLDDDTASKISQLCKREGPYIFGDFSPLSLTKISDHFEKDLKIAGLPHVRLHDLRHSNVSMLWAAGVPIPEISKRIGHSSPKITMETYAHIFDNSQSSSLNFLNSLGK